MRKFFTLLTMCMLFSAAWADTVVTFIPGETVGSQESVSTSDQMEKDGITISTTYGAFKAAQYRFGMNAVTTIKSEIGNITKIEFTGANGTNPISGFGDNEGMTYTGNDGTWTGNAEEVVLTTRVKQARATKIVVYVSGSGLAAPRINPPGGTYFEPFQVTITCPNSDAKIYYTTNGADPTTSSTKYTAPFTVSSNMTVKAISELNGETSGVVTAQYVFSDRLGLGGLAALEDNTDVTLGYEATVLHQAGSTMYIKDDTGYGLIYGNVGHTYTKGDVIASGYGGLKVTYNAEPEVKNPVGFGNPLRNVTVNPEQITCSLVNHEHWAHYVVINDAVITMTDDNNGTLTDATGSCALYNRTFGASLPNDGQPHKVIGIIASYQPGGQGDVTYQVLPIIVDNGGGGGNATEVGIGELPNVADNKDVTLVHDATVIWQGGRNNAYLYVKDETGYGLIYGNTGQTYYIGDIIPAGYTGKKTTYKGEPELTNPAGMQPATTFVHLTPDILTTQGVNHDNWAHYVLIKNAKLNDDKNMLTDASGTCEFYNGTFNIELPTDGAAHDWYGIVAVFNNYQFLPLSWDKEPERPAPPEPTYVASINELYNDVAEGEQATFTTPLTAIYQYGLRLYVQDVEGTQTLVYGSVPGEFTNGDVINDAVASWGTYQAAKQMIPADNFVPAGRTAKVQPDDPLPIEEISQDMIHRYLSFEDVNIVMEDGKYYMVDETGRIQLFDQFKVLESITLTDDPYYVEGFLTIFRGELEVYPTYVSNGPDCGIKGDVNDDKEINIADVNALIDIILSGRGDQCARWRADVNDDLEVNIADVNALISLILSGH